MVTADFSTDTALLNKTSILAAGELDAATPLVTSAVAIGSGQFPYEPYAKGIDFYVKTTDGTNAIGDLTINVQVSTDKSTWYTAPAVSVVTAVPNAETTRFHIEVGSRLWRYVRLSMLVENAQETTISTADVSAQLSGLWNPITKTES